MPRRVSLPGADELFRTTGGSAFQAPPPVQDGMRRRAARDGDADQEDEVRPEPAVAGAPGAPGTVGFGEGGPAGSEEHTGREAVPPAQRRPMGGERPGAVQPALSPSPVATATVSASVPPITAAPPVSSAPPAASAGRPTPPPITATPQPASTGRRKAPRQNRRPSGRERHDEKITVYVSAEELMDLEHARLVLRGEHGLAIDRGRIVREAVAVVLADLESRGDASILVRRLRGR
ncbi:hypothetical protein [Actinacidiphila yeochonensis]|uniref:hypothetical protein n=1 Tax=Actinacidiphila yeochonensis TaxID=89050 RepID=UPI000AF4B43A|nr:hypothetical protein [Actinacidiphila yeochonensis]